MKTIKLFLCVVFSILMANVASALVVGPYTPDANTVYLFHFNEPAGTFIATNAAGALAAGTNAYAFATAGNVYPGDNINAPTNTLILGTNGATGFVFGNFGNAANVTNVNQGVGIDLKNNGGFSLNDGAPSLDGDTLANYNTVLGPNNSFTIEALVNLPNTNSGTREIVCGDTAEGNRGFQFRFNGPNIEWNLISSPAAADVFAPVPSTGGNAFVPNAWFHVAVSHTEIPVAGGTNTIIYWTRLSDSTISANPIFTNTVSRFPATAVPLMLVIGNEGRGSGASAGSTEGLLGVVDEVRISNTVRNTNQMMFSDGSITISQSPSSVVVSPGATASFSVTASSPISSWAALGYQWRSNGVPLVNGGDFSGVNSSNLVIANVQSAYAGSYDVVITNLYSTNTSSAATLTIRIPLNLSWRGAATATWDATGNTNWFDTGGLTNSPFTAGDNATFDDNGVSASVSIPGTVQPGALTVSASSVNYTFSGNGKVTGAIGLSKSGSGTLTIQTTNDYTGVTTVSGGTVSVAQLANGGSASAIGAAGTASANLVLDNGDLQYTGPTASVNRGATLNSGGGTIEVSTAANTLTLGGAIAGTSGGSLSKAGNGTLALSGVNTYDGATTVSAGTMQLTGSGTFGAGAITNNSSLLFSGTRTIANVITGSGSITNDATGTLTLTGANSFTGPMTINGPSQGGLVVGSSSALGSTPSVTVVSTTGGSGITGTRITLNAGVSTPVGTTLSLPATGAGAVRSALLAAGASSWNGPISIVGDSTADQLAIAGSGGLLTINGNISLSAGFGTGTLQLRGDGSGNAGFGGIVNGTISLSTATLQVNDGVTWTINSTGNTWGTSQIAHGTLQLGANNALPTSTILNFGAAGTAALDLNGFNQQVAGLVIAASVNIITNSSALADSTLTYAGLGSSTFSGAIVEGSHKTALTVSSGTLTLSGANTYSGNTTISGGTLALSGSGSIANSPNVAIGSGTKLDLSGLSSTLTLGSGQSLVGSGGTGTINSNLNLGAGSLVLNYTSGTPTLMETNGIFTLNSNSVTVTVQGSALSAGSYKLISAANGGSVTGTLPSTVTVNGAGVAGGTQTSLKVVSGELYLIVNTPPVATLYNTSRSAGITSFKIALTDLATHWTDADGDAINFVSVGTSTNGIILSTNGGYILYNNANNVDDQFTYVIADTNGATATGVVNITVSSSSSGSQNIASEKINNDGTVTLNLAGIPGYSYRTQATTNLISGPWIDISTNAAGSNGLWQVNDSDATNYPSRYYRTVYP